MCDFSSSTHQRAATTVSHIEMRGNGIFNVLVTLNNKMYRTELVRFVVFIWELGAIASGHWVFATMFPFPFHITSISLNIYQFDRTRNTPKWCFAQFKSYLFIYFFLLFSVSLCINNPSECWRYEFQAYVWCR